MMDWMNNHYKTPAWLISRHTWFYTEMMVTETIVHQKDTLQSEGERLDHLCRRRTTRRLASPAAASYLPAECFPNGSSVSIGLSSMNQRPYLLASRCPDLLASLRPATCSGAVSRLHAHSLHALW